MDFFNEYGSWILFAGMAFLMFRMHGNGGGCCGGGQHNQNHDENQDEMTDEERQKNNKSGCH